jgi:hypothetical protein
VESSCEFGIEPSGSVKCWETIECPNNYLSLRVVLSSMELVPVEVGWGDVDFIGLVQDRARWRALMNSLLYLRVS